MEKILQTKKIKIGKTKVEIQIIQRMLNSIPVYFLNRVDYFGSSAISNVSFNLNSITEQFEKQGGLV